ncbi:MAG: BamA/TamA family outer membrane protein [Anaeromyxobacter sp.]
MRKLALLALALAPVAGSAQGFNLSAPSIGDSLRMMDRLREDAERREAERGFHQAYVLPERPGQNKVAWYDFEWEYVDVPAPGGGRGGIRLYYYKSALAQAQRALPAIQSAYARLVDQFAYQPTKRIPYFLYATQREFQATNIFQIGESTLGVTSNQSDLRMLVPYFGDHSKFIEVSTHEMVHQFMIQKLNDAAEAEDLGSLANVLPLWFTEGIAEYYTKGGLDIETEGYLRDLVWNPDPSEGYMMIPFAEDRARGYIPTYKLGQARVAFIAEEYGRDKIQGLIENAYLLGDGAGAPPGGRSFGALVRRVLDEPLEQVEARWKSWLKRRYYTQYLKTKQDLSQMKELRNLPAEPEDFTASADGQLILMRGIDREKGRARLYLFDVRNPRSAQEVASDGKPGTESLHPIEFAVGTVGPGILAFSAQDGQGDSLYVRRYRVNAKEGKPPSIDLGKLRKLAITASGGRKFIQIADPAFSADGSHIAFSALVAGDAQSDVWVASVEGGEARRLTNDPYVERDLHWGPDGIYVASDATDHGLLNLFRIDAGTGEKVRLTTAPHNDRHPYAQADGSVLYASDSDGKVDLYLLKDAQIRRVTDFTTGLSSPAPAPKARGIFATTFNSGRFRLVEVPKSAWQESQPVAVGPAAGPPLEIPRAEWPEQPKDYEAFAMKNWRPEGGYVFGGGAGNTVAGRAAVLFSDLLRDNQLYVDLAVYGSFDYTQGLFLYENRSHRYGLVLGGFHYVQQNLDSLDPNLVYYQRDFGLVGAIRYPLDRFRRVELELTASGVQRYCLTDFNSAELTLPCNASGLARPPYDSQQGWKDRNGGTNMQLSPVVRFGYDTTRYDPATGPVSGSSATLEIGAAYLPGRAAITGFARTDLERYFQLGTRANFMLRAAAGTSFSPGGADRVWERNYWLTAADNLRGFYPGEYGNLIGRNYYVANAELQIPLDPLIRFFIFDYVEGVAALDFGGVFDRFDGSIIDNSGGPTQGQIIERGAWDARTLTGVLGFNMLFGPLILRLHWGHPYNIGGYETTALANGSKWVTHLTLRYFFQ